MLQFHTRRWWTIVLASVLTIAVGSSSSPEIARANGGDYSIESDYDYRAPDTPPPIGTGDPDMPSGTTRQSGRSGREQGTAGTFRGQLAPNGALTAQEVWSLRLRITLSSLRAFVLHR